MPCTLLSVRPLIPIPAGGPVPHFGRWRPDGVAALAEQGPVARQAKNTQ